MSTADKAKTAQVGAILCALLLQSCAAKPRFVDRDIDFHAVHATYTRPLPKPKKQKIFPQIDIDGTCRDAARLGASDDSGKHCLRSERKAKEEFARLWSAITPQDVETCIEPTWQNPSYVEMVTCVEINDKSLAVAASGGGTVAPRLGDVGLPADAARIDTLRLRSPTAIPKTPPDAN